MFCALGVEGGRRHVGWEGGGGGGLLTAVYGCLKTGPFEMLTRFLFSLFCHNLIVGTLHTCSTHRRIVC